MRVWQVKTTLTSPYMPFLDAVPGMHTFVWTNMRSFWNSTPKLTVLCRRSVLLHFGGTLPLASACSFYQLQPEQRTKIYAGIISAAYSLVAPAPRPLFMIHISLWRPAAPQTRQSLRSASKAGANSSWKRPHCRDNVARLVRLALHSGRARHSGLDRAGGSAARAWPHPSGGTAGRSPR
jgi:hypothetical protein